MSMAVTTTPEENPFSTAKLYREAGFLGTIPIPYGLKHPPPRGYTGNAAPYPDDEKMAKWAKLGQGNIALRLSKVDYVPEQTIYQTTSWELIGIDVDDYKD